MPVDPATYISELDETLPAGVDPASEGPANYRHVKTVLKNSLPNVSEPITETAEKLNGLNGRVSALEASSQAQAVQEQALFDLLYPVGSLYYQRANGDLPAHFATYGTWQTIDGSFAVIYYSPVATTVFTSRTLNDDPGGEDYLLYVRTWERIA